MHTRALRALGSRRTLLPAAAVGMLAAFTAVSSFAFFTRWWTDDYCAAASVHGSGFLRAQWNEYVGWSGRFTATATIDAVTALPVWVGAWFPPLLLALWVAGLAWTASQLLPRDVTHRRALGWLLGAGVATLAMSATPDPEQTVGWISTAATYLLPLVLATPALGLAARAIRTDHRASQWPAAAAAGMLALLAAGSTETLGAMLALGALLALAVLLRHGGRPAPGVIVVAAIAVGAAVGTALIGAAPGNYIRATAIGHHPALLDAGIPALHGSLQLVSYLLQTAPAATLLAFVMPLALAAFGITANPTTTHAASARTLLGGALGGIALLWASFAPSFYGTGLVPPPRALLVPIAFLLALLAAAGHLTGATLLASRAQTSAATHTRPTSAARRVRTGAGHTLACLALTAMVLALVGLGPVRSAVVGVGEGLRAHRIAQAWDARDASIRSAAAAHLTSVHMPFVETTPHQSERLAAPWFLGCASTDYGILVTSR